MGALAPEGALVPETDGRMIMFGATVRGLIGATRCGGLISTRGGGDLTVTPTERAAAPTVPASMGNRVPNAPSAITEQRAIGNMPAPNQLPKPTTDYLSNSPRNYKSMTA